MSNGCIDGDMIVDVKMSDMLTDNKIKLSYLYKLFTNNRNLIFRIRSFVDDKFVYMPIKTVVDKGTKNCIQIICNNTKLICTPDHLILTNKGWIEAHKLQINDIVYTDYDEKSEVIKVLDVGYRHVYDIEIDDKNVHNFIANNVVVHNCGKTLQAITLARYKKLHRGLKHCLIVCGVNSLKWNWKKEIEKFCNDEKAIILGTKINSKR